MTSPFDHDSKYWAARAPDVPHTWFRRRSRVHGPSHTQRVHVHAQRLLAALDWSDEDARVVLCAALWHDIGRETDGVEPRHGELSVLRADHMGLMAALPPADAAVVRFAVHQHSLPDPGADVRAAELAAHPDVARRIAHPQRALDVLGLLKDADALDRVRLGFGECADPRQLRHPETVASIPFAAALFAVLH